MSQDTTDFLVYFFGLVLVVTTALYRIWTGRERGTRVLVIEYDDPPEDVEEWFSQKIRSADGDGVSMQWKPSRVFIEER